MMLAAVYYYYYIPAGTWLFKQQTYQSKNKNFFLKLNLDH